MMDNQYFWNIYLYCFIPISHVLTSWKNYVSFKWINLYEFSKITDTFFENKIRLMVLLKRRFIYRQNILKSEKVQLSSNIFAEILKLNI